MSKKVNFGTINQETISTLSAWNVAKVELSSLKKKLDADKAPHEEAIEKAKKNRQTDIDAGLPVDEAVRKWPTEEHYTAISALEEAYKKACEPHKKAQKAAYAMIEDIMYYSYVLAMQKGDCGATGKLTVKKGKDEVIYTFDKSFKGYIADFLEKIGCYTDNATALGKFADVMKTRTAGVVKSNKDGEYIKAKSPSQFKELFVRAFLQYVIVDKGVVTVNDDNTLSMTVFPTE